MAKLIKRSGDGFEFDTNQSISSPTTAYDFKINGSIVASIDENGLSNGSAFATVFPTGLSAPADKNNIEAVISAVNSAGGGVIHLTKGTYDLTGASNGISIVGNNIIIQGEGVGTLLQGNGDTVLNIQGTAGSTNQVLNNYTAGDSSIFTTTAGDAANFPAGASILIDGTEDITGEDQVEYNIVISNNPGTGEVVLKYPTKFTLTSVQADVLSTTNGKNITIRDLKIERLGSDQFGILFQNFDYGLVDCVYIEDSSTDTPAQDAISGSNGTNFVVRNTRIENWRGGTAVILSGCTNNRVENNDFLNCNFDEAVNKAGVRALTTSFNSWIINNRIYNQGGSAIWADAPTAKVFILHNDILRCHGADTILIEGDNCITENNTLQNCEFDGISVAGNESRQVIRGNRIINQSDTGILVGTGTEEYIISDNIINTADEGIIANGARASISGNSIRNINREGIGGIWSYSTISNNSIQNIALTAAASGITWGTGTDNTIANNSIEDATTSGTRGIRITSSRNRVIDNIIDNMSSVAIDTLGSGQSENIIKGNHISNCLGGIDFFATDNKNQILNNYFKDITGNAIDVFGGTSDPVEQWIISGNIFEGISADAIMLDACQNFIVTENIAIDSITGDALQITDNTVISDSLIVKNNNFTGNTINDTSTGTNNIFADNLV